MRSVTLAWMLLWVAPAAALADVDLSKSMLCAVTQVIECGYGEKCSYGPPEDVNLPPFVWLEPGSMTLREHGGERKSKLSVLAEKDGELLLHGYEERAFAISISEKTGRLSASATAHDMGLVIFGSCTNP